MKITTNNLKENELKKEILKSIEDIKNVKILFFILGYINNLKKNSKI